MYISSVSIENFRAFKEKTVFHFNPGVTVLIGENDCGKSTVIDAIRYVLGTTDQSWQRIELSDYHQENTDNEIHITITFSNLTVILTKKENYGEHSILHHMNFELRWEI